ncbi:MAG: DUF5696 domain-containing protein [Oscillospiraceae bacterium]|nr:DUF5696 domain-containing protein [Oscillospiraceae bacterium]
MKIKAFCLMLALTAALVLTPVSKAETAGETGSALSGAPVSESGEFQRVSETAGYELYYHSKTAEVAALDKRTGKFWRSNPENRAEDAIAIPSVKNNLASQFILYYFDGESLTAIDSFSQSVALGQHTASINGDTLTVRYRVGQEQFQEDWLPLLISRERMEEKVLDKLEEEDRDYILERYHLYVLKDLEAELGATLVATFPSLKDHDIYVRSKMSGYIGEKVYKLFEKAGYTHDDLAFDCNDNGLENTYKEQIFYELAIHYRLTEDGLQAWVDPAGIEESETYPVVRLELLPYFGSGDAQTEGKMLVPDGSGAVIHYNNGKRAAEPYWVKLFGEDKARGNWEQKNVAPPSVLPVFGVSHSDGAFLGTIDAGYECAGIKADVSGRICEFNTVGAFFEVRAYDTVSVTGSFNAYDTTVITAPARFSGNLTVTYRFLPEAADYSKMANVYRALLLKTGVLKENAGETAPLNLELTASALVRKSFFGINYQTVAPLTGFDDALTILNELGVPAQLKYTNAVNGGQRQKRLDTVKPLPGLGGSKALAELQEKARTDISVRFREAYNVPKSLAARLLSKDTAKIYSFDFIARYVLDHSNAATLLSAEFLETQSQKLLASMEKQKLRGLHLQDGVASLDSDFNSAGYKDRKAIREGTERFLKTLSQKHISADHGSYYSFAYLSKIWDFPDKSGGYIIEDETVPFYAMTVRGSVAYCTAPLNETADSREAFLRAVEIGAGISYTWVFTQPEKPVDTADDYYNRQYTGSIEEARVFAGELVELRQKIGETPLISHKKLSETLTESLFGSGAVVYVNYADTAVEFGGVSVPARGFFAVEK